MNVRVACARVLAKVIRQEASLNTLLPAMAAQIDEKEFNLFQEICYGTLRHYPALQIIAAKLLTKPLKRKDWDILVLIMSGLYQLREMRTPSHAAVNETVSACNGLKKTWARGVVNSTLRRYLREREQIDSECANDPTFQSLHPDWLQHKLTAAWGEQATSIMAANNRRAPMTLRVNQQQFSRQAYLDRLATQGIAARPAPFAPQGIYLESPCNVSELPDFATGAVSVQDEAAQLCGELLDLAPGQRVLDCCCAPGGKTCHILEHEPALAAVVALDADEKRLQLVQQNLDRLHLSAALKAADASRVEDWWDQKLFDRILLDAPCSATGVIRRHPDIKVLRREEDIAKLAATQLKILSAVWATLNEGGKLLYATCSILPEENDDVITAFCSQQGNCHSININESWGTATRWGRQLFPTQDGHDGFYYALLTKQTAARETNQ